MSQNPGQGAHVLKLPADVSSVLFLSRLARQGRDRRLFLRQPLLQLIASNEFRKAAGGLFRRKDGGRPTKQYVQRRKPSADLDRGPQVVLSLRRRQRVCRRES